MKKVKDYAYKDIIDFEKIGILEPFGNAHYFMVKFISSSYNNRRNKNPHNIKYSQMKSKFGDPNFQDDYNGAYWWILSFHKKMFAITTHDIDGSQICQFLPDKKDYCYDKQFSIDAENFNDHLFSLFSK